MGVYRDPSIETLNLERIAEINSRVPTPTWRAGQTSLFGESFSEVLAYRMGELPASDLERSGDRTAVRDFLSEMEEKVNAFSLGKKRKKRDLGKFFSDLSSAGRSWSRAGSQSFNNFTHFLN